MIVQQFNNRIGYKKSTGNLQEDILNFLCKWEKDETRENFRTGSSISYTISYLRDIGWRGIRSQADFEYMVEGFGFKIKKARTKSGYHKTIRVISI